MNKTNKKKNFDAIKMMRDIRSKLNEKYLKDPDGFKKELDIIDEKYGIKKRETSLKRGKKLTAH